MQTSEVTLLHMLVSKGNFVSKVEFKAYASASVFMSHRLNTLYPSNTANNSIAMFIMDVIRIFEPAGKGPPETLLYCSAWRMQKAISHMSQEWTLNHRQHVAESCCTSCHTGASSSHKHSVLYSILLKHSSQHGHSMAS